MSSAKIIPVGSKEEYQCITCGNTDVAIIRQDATNPRCKCNSCGFVFSGADSLAAKEAGAIGDSSPETLAGADEADREVMEDDNFIGSDNRVPKTKTRVLPTTHGAVGESIPRSPTYCFIAKDRKRPRVEFCTLKDVKSVAIKWHEIKHDVYELTPKKFDVKLDIT